MNKTFFIGFLVSLLISSCTQPPIKESKISRNSDIVIIKPDYSEQVFEISDLIDSIKYVKLELTENSIIGELTKMIIFEDRIYILDMKTSSLFTFDINGKYISKICNVGQGPDEYTQLDFFTIDKEQRHLVLTDLVGYWVMRYDFDGNYLSRKKIPFWIRDIAPVNNMGYVLYMNYINNNKKITNEFNFYYTDSLLQIKESYFPYETINIGAAQNKLSTPEGGVFYDGGEFYNFVTTYNDTVYQVNSVGLIPKYVFDFDDKKINPNIFHTNEDELLTYLKKSDFRSINTFFEDDHSITFQTTYGFQTWTGFYNKNTGHIINSSFFINEGVNFFINNKSMYKGWYVGYMSVDVLMFEKEGLDKRISGNEVGKQQSIELLNNISDEDNMVLKFYKLKDF